MPRGARDRDVDQDDEEHEDNGEHDDEDDGAAPDLDETQKRYRSLSRDESAKADDEEFENICANLKRVSVTISRVLTAASPLIGGQESLGADAGELPAAADAADHAGHVGNGNGVKSAGAPSAAADMAGSMEDLRLWYETEVFADGEGQQRSWDVRKWAFMQQLSKELSRPLTSSPLPFLLEAPPNPSGADRARWRNPCSSSLDVATEQSAAPAAFGAARAPPPAEAGWRVEGVLEGGLVFVGRSRCVHSRPGARERAPLAPPLDSDSPHLGAPSLSPRVPQVQRRRRPRRPRVARALHRRAFVRRRRRVRRLVGPRHHHDGPRALENARRPVRQLHVGRAAAAALFRRRAVHAAAPQLGAAARRPPWGRRRRRRHRIVVLTARRRRELRNFVPPELLRLAATCSGDSRRHLCSHLSGPEPER